MEDLLNSCIKLLEIAKCPNCDGSGVVQKQIQSRQYVTREMAVDAGDPQLEGMLYCDDEWDFEQCQWCDERKQIMDKHKLGTNSTTNNT